MKNLIKPKIRTNWLYIIIITLIASFIIGGILIYQYQWWQLKEIEENRLTYSSCLTSDEIADYPIDEKYAKELKYPKFPVIIYIKEDKHPNKEKFKFQIENVSKAVHSLEMYKCNIYVIRVFNFDEKRGIPLSDYRTELWQFHYDGNGEKLITLFKKEGAPDNFGQDFRIDAQENYLFLERSYLGNPNYALVIKDLKTKEDVFVLTLDEVLKKYSNIGPGSFGLGVFTPDDKYFWGNLYEGAYDIAYFRIELDTWKTDILPSPSDLPSGSERDFNFKGWFAYADIASFTGLEGVTEQIEEEARKAGKMKNLWIYNLFTKEKVKIASADPSHRFKPKWLSDTELEYELPSGERKVYVVKE